MSFCAELERDVIKIMTVEQLSPELISATQVRENMRGVSNDIIYKFIWQAKFSNIKEHQEFKKTYKILKHGRKPIKRGNYTQTEVQYRIGGSMEKRSKSADRKETPGDIEVDIIGGKNHKAGFLVMLDSASLVTYVDRISSKKSKHIKRLIVKRMKNNQHLKTKTFDNDQALVLHHEIAIELNIKTFFTRPYTSQDIGNIENKKWNNKKVSSKENRLYRNKNPRY